ncbi:MAG: rRNA maturation RNase YbeY [Bacteroidetes bacterium]|nr:rRNA maturation RNase YbeY [Bacteroidota bacterium]
MGITFHYRDIAFRLKRLSAVRKWLLSSIRNEKKAAGEISFIFTDDGSLLALNRKFLRHNFYTDILTFDGTRTGYPAGRLKPAKRKPDTILSGDIFISIDRVKDNALRYGIPFSDELRRVMIHGILHLCGYKDHGRKNMSVMRNKEDEYLKRYNS